MLGSGTYFPVMLHVLVHLFLAQPWWHSYVESVAIALTSITLCFNLWRAEGSSSLNLKTSSNGNVIYDLMKGRPSRSALECET